MKYIIATLLLIAANAHADLNITDKKVVDFFRSIPSSNSLLGTYTISNEEVVQHTGDCSDFNLTTSMDGTKRLLVFADNKKGKSVKMEFETVGLKTHKTTIINNNLIMLSYTHETCYYWDNCPEGSNLINATTNRAEIKTNKDGEIQNITLESSRSSIETISPRDHYKFTAECSAKNQNKGELVIEGP